VGRYHSKLVCLSEEGEEEEEEAVRAVLVDVAPIGCFRGID
jgi:hypothetical protein